MQGSGTKAGNTRSKGKRTHQGRPIAARRPHWRARSRRTGRSSAASPGCRRLLMHAHADAQQRTEIQHAAETLHTEGTEVRCSVVSHVAGARPPWSWTMRVRRPGCAPARASGAPPAPGKALQGRHENDSRENLAQRQARAVDQQTVQTHTHLPFGATEGQHQRRSHDSQAFGKVTSQRPGQRTSTPSGQATSTV